MAGPSGKKYCNKVREYKKTGHDFHSHTHTHTEQKKSGCAHTKMKIKYINVPVSSWRDF